MTSENFGAGGETSDLHSLERSDDERLDLVEKLVDGVLAQEITRAGKEEGGREKEKGRESRKGDAKRAQDGG